MKKKLCLLFVCLFLLAGLSACGGDYKLKSFNNITTTELKDGINKNIKALKYDLVIPEFTKDTYVKDGKTLDKYISKISTELTVNISSSGTESVYIYLDKKNIDKSNLQKKTDEFTYVAFGTMLTIDPTIKVADMITKLNMTTGTSGSTKNNGYNYIFDSSDSGIIITIYK